MFVTTSVERTTINKLNVFYNELVTCLHGSESRAEINVILPSLELSYSIRLIPSNEEIGLVTSYYMHSYN